MSGTDNIGVEIEKLKLFLIALDEQDQILIDDMKIKKSVEVPITQSRVISNIFKDVRSDYPVTAAITSYP